MSNKEQKYYPLEFKEEALKLVALNGGNIRQTALNLGVSVQTLHD